MKFTSIREYFYKLHNILYAVILVPLVPFGYLYLEIQANKLVPVYTNEPTMIVAFLAFLVVLEWIVSGFLFSSRLKQHKLLTSLGERMEKYADLTIVRFSIVSFSGLFLGAGLYLTHHPVFIAMFVFNIILMSLVWPLPGKLCRDLALKGDEKDMVLHRRDS